MTLYLKYRPTTFSDISGHEHVKKIIRSAIRLGRPSQAYLFTGPRGTGKTTLARVIARAINCLNPTQDFDPCNECNVCTGILDGSIYDVIEIDAASNRGIDEVRDLREKVHFLPHIAAKKVYIIDEVHMMTKEAFNALLKTLEEPPKHVHFIFATTEIHKVPDTIISRCQRFDLSRIDEQDIVERLSFIAKEEAIEAEGAALKLIARHAEGGLRDAISLLEKVTTDQKITLENTRLLLGLVSDIVLGELYVCIRNGDTDAAVKLIQDIYAQGFDPVQTIRHLLHILRDDLGTAIGKRDLAAMNRIIAYTEILLGANNELKSTPLPLLTIEKMVVKCCLLTMSKQTTEKPAVAEKQEVKEVVSKEPDTKAVDTSPIVEHERPFMPLNETKTAEDKPQVVLSVSSDIQDKWHSIATSITKISLRISLKSAQVREMDGKFITLAFASEFQRDIVRNEEALLYSEIKRITGDDVALKYLIDHSLAPKKDELLNLTTAPRVESTPAAPSEALAPSGLSESMIFDMFGATN